ncbi:hypothetical protein L227DRAFT_584223 [Lentinus tigrinus ALCF2SS1-6]|uniref:Mid2 domain-containing protein n=1 Tax=Lentinus tigrinus ALCF2SS1-6 TaxID=1328759 RepID=A0A5C2SJ66_9APHY|nr:hypothetical protein L227DRAFT_584223 [Lentinus tigrinus ALCF2SS1-6]
MLGYSKSATVAFLLTFLLLLGHANGAPAIPEKRTHSALRVARDGENLSQSTTVQVTQTIQTSTGSMIQTCSITLDPITGDNGEPLVRETRSCTLTPTGGNNQSGSSTSSSDSSTSTTSSADSSATSSTDSSAASSTDSSAASSTDSSAASSTDSAASSSATNASASGTALSSADTAAATATGSASGSASASATATGSSAAATGGAVNAGGFSTVDGSVVKTESIASTTASATAAADAANQSGSTATSAADTATSSAAKFQLPGTQLSVLPIGLGVFAGISVIALIVVGLVTYERTKYRRAFRQRKLAESGAAMGYGGMA